MTILQRPSLTPRRAAVTTASTLLVIALLVIALATVQASGPVNASESTWVRSTGAVASVDLVEVERRPAGAGSSVGLTVLPPGWALVFVLPLLGGAIAAVATRHIRRRRGLAA